MSLTTTAAPAAMGLEVRTFDDAVRLAKAMSSAGLVPKHLQGDVGSCLLIVEQAMRWRMSPFAVAQCTSSIGGKLMHEGKLIAAAVRSMGAITGHFDYEWSGAGQDRTIVVRATRTGETEPREVRVRLGDVATTNAFWKTQPDQQLAYAGARIWARRWTPEALLGVYAPEEWGTPDGPVIEAKADQAATQDIRQQINEAVPMRSDAAWTAWLLKLRLSLSGLATKQEVEDAAARPTIAEALATAPDWVRKDIEEIVADATQQAVQAEAEAATPGGL